MFVHVVRPIVRLHHSERYQGEGPSVGDRGDQRVMMWLLNGQQHLDASTRAELGYDVEKPFERPHLDPPVMSVG
jgi:hypothetical protein